MSEGKNLAKLAASKDSATGPYVVEDKAQPPFKVPEGVKVLAFKYPRAVAPDNKTFFAIVPPRPPGDLVGVTGDFLQELYKAARERDELMRTDEELVKFVLPLTQDEDIEKKFFANATLSPQEKIDAIDSYAKDSKIGEVVATMLRNVVLQDKTQHLRAIVSGYSALMKQVRCEASAEVIFGRIPTRNEVIRVKQLIGDLRSATQYYVHSIYGVDDSLGGGLVIRAGDFEVDGSTDTRCAEVQKHFNKSF
jgi:F0F1-type ATP synthase delta subunit